MAVEHALAKANNCNTKQGPVLKVRDSADQLIVGLVLHSHGRLKTIGTEGCSFITKKILSQVVSKGDREVYRLIVMS